MKEGSICSGPRRSHRWNRSTPQVPLRVAADPLDALRGPVRGSGDRHRHPTHRGSGHHAAADAATPRAPNTGSAARRSRHLDAEVREDPDHGLRSVSNAQPCCGSPSTGLLTGSTGKPAPLEFLQKSECIFASFLIFLLFCEQSSPSRPGLPILDGSMSAISESKLLLSYFLLFAGLQPSAFSPSQTRIMVPGSPEQRGRGEDFSGESRPCSGVCALASRRWSSGLSRSPSVNLCPALRALPAGRRRSLVGSGVGLSAAPAQR